MLDLAKSQKVDLANISITQLADQFIEFINSAKKINLDLASEYLLMATWLAYLKSKLLLPQMMKMILRFQKLQKIKASIKKIRVNTFIIRSIIKKKKAWNRCTYARYVRRY